MDVSNTGSSQVYDRNDRSRSATYNGMKGASFNGLRGKQYLFILTIFICTAIVFWARERTPFVVTDLQPQEDQLNILSPGIPTDSPPGYSIHNVEERKETTVEEDSSLSPKEGEVENIQPGEVTSSHEEVKRDKNLTSPMEKKECNHARGKWVADSRRPLYSGFGCKQWLSGMWACRLTQRTDFSYEGFRWQPENCDMPEFEGTLFLKKMEDKTLAFVGDSLGRQQFQSLMCMITGGKDAPEVEDVGWSYGLVKAKGAKRPDGWAYRFPSTNTTVLYYWSATLCELEPLNASDPETEYAVHLDRPVTFLRQNLQRFNVLVLNTGHHWNRGKLQANRWVIYVDGMPNTNKALAPIGSAKNFTVYSVVKWLDSQLPNHPQLKAFFRTISPRHFVNGDWNTGGSCDNTIPLAGGSEVTQDKSSDPDAEGAVRDTGVKLLDITGLSQLRDECHISKYSSKAATDGIQDCLHWCLPGLPDTWNELIFAQLWGCQRILALSKRRE